MVEYICPNCGDTVKMQEEVELWDCAICDTEMRLRKEAGVVPESELRELAEDLRERAEKKMDEVDTESPSYTGNTGSLCLGLRLAADELEELIEKHEEEVTYESAN